LKKQHFSPVFPQYPSSAEQWPTFLGDADQVAIVVNISMVMKASAFCLRQVVSLMTSLL